MMRSKTLFILFFLFQPWKFTYAQKDGLKIGNKAPLFKVKSHSGDTIDLSSLLNKHPVVLFFYRGSWCPYCNKQMSELQDSAQLIVNKGATILAVSPETDTSMNKMVEQSKAAFTFISDVGYKIMNAYNVSFKVGDATVKKYKLWGLDIEKANGNTDDILPVPATYIIDKDGIIKYVFFNTDYKKRATVKEILTHL